MTNYHKEIGVAPGTFNASDPVELTLPEGFTVGDVCLVAHRLTKSGNAGVGQTAWVIYRAAKDAIEKEDGTIVANRRTATLSVPKIVAEIFARAVKKQSRRTGTFCDDGPNWLWDRYYS